MFIAFDTRTKSITGFTTLKGLCCTNKFNYDCVRQKDFPQEIDSVKIYELPPEFTGTVAVVLISVIDYAMTYFHTVPEMSEFYGWSKHSMYRKKYPFKNKGFYINKITFEKAKKETYNIKNLKYVKDKTIKNTES